ncbi:MAG: hypothetical protein QME96_14655 [Myxococcota bacterium]|nr:hypothetical protein [Myxococcota bacterium]
MSRVPLLVLGAGLGLSCDCDTTRCIPQDAAPPEAEAPDEVAPPDAEASDADGAEAEVILDVGPEVTPRFRRFRPPEDCGTWDAGEVTAPQEPPAGTERLSLKWIFVPGFDDEFLRRGYVGGGEAFGPLAERLDGGICTVMGGKDGVGCVDRDGRFEWSWRGDYLDIVGGPTVLPDGRIATIHRVHEMIVYSPHDPLDRTSRPHGLGWAALDIRSGIEASWPYSPAVTADGFFLRSFDWQVLGGDDVGGWVTAFQPTDLEFFNPCLWPVWQWEDLGFWDVQRYGGVMGDRIVLLLGPEFPYDWSRARLVTVRSDGTLEDVPPIQIEGDVWMNRLFVLGGDKIAYQVLSIDVVDPRWTDWCVRDLYEAAARCVRLEGVSNEWLRLVAAPDGTPVGVRIPNDPTDPDRRTMIAAWDADGRLRWSHVVNEGRCSHVCLSAPVVAADGSVLVFLDTDVFRGSEWDGTNTILHLFSADGRVVDTLLVEQAGGVTVHGTAPILTRDGTLYHVIKKRREGGSPASTLRGVIAIQMPVQGAAPEDPGWPIYDRRTTRGDLWAR